MYPTYAEAKYREGELIRLSQKHKVDRVPRSERRSIFPTFGIPELTRRLHVTTRKPAPAN